MKNKPDWMLCDEENPAFGPPEKSKVSRDLKAENCRLKQAIKTFSDTWKDYDNQTIKGIDELRAALRREEL